MSKLKKICESLFPSNHYGWMGVLFLLVLLPNLFVTFLSSDLAGNILKQGAYLLFSCMLLILPALVLKSRWYFLLLSIFFLFSPLEITHVVLNRMPVTEGFMSAILHTDRMEAYEHLSYLKTYIFIGAVLIVLFYWILFTRIENRPLFTLKGKLFVAGVFILFNVGLWGAMWHLSSGVTSKIHRLSSANSNLVRKYYKTYPLDLFLATKEVFDARKEVRKMEEKLKDFHFGVEKRDSIQTKELYVLVIGESARYSNFSINGYERETSPLLKSRSGITSYSDVLSTSNYTRVVLPLLLTRATPFNPDLAHEEKALTDAFKECGFDVAWIANQSVGDRFVQRITANADYTSFSTTDYDSANSYDERLLDPLSEVLGQDNDKQFIVIHTLGSHFRYNARYPDAFSRFTPALQDKTSYGGISVENKELLVNSYDNSIYYTDYVLNEIIRKIEEKNAISMMFYISDHAENLFDDSQDLIMHGTPNPSLWEIHVPLFVWTSDRYRETWPEKANNIEENRNEKISTTNVFHSLLDMANISYPSERNDLSIASPAFKADSIRYVLTPDRAVVER